MSDPIELESLNRQELFAVFLSCDAYLLRTRSGFEVQKRRAELFKIDPAQYNRFLNDNSSQVQYINGIRKICSH
ncbi:MAG: hypothetical protein AAF544_08025, partial [Bacteroidota bacterium]